MVPYRRRMRQAEASTVSPGRAAVLRRLRERTTELVDETVRRMWRDIPSHAVVRDPAFRADVAEHVHAHRIDQDVVWHGLLEAAGDADHAPSVLAMVGTMLDYINGPARMASIRWSTTAWMAGRRASIRLTTNGAVTIRRRRTCSGSSMCTNVGAWPRMCLRAALRCG